MRNRKGTRGAISVFLAIILVPCIVISCVFVDLSRVHLSKTSAESAADLALNTLLTNYDADLKDWYGMVSSCQNIDEFYEVSANYFLRALSSQGMSDDEIILLSDYYAQATQNDKIYDLLKVESQSGAAGMIKGKENANLTNAALIKDQVIEFMKYRGPIEITSNLISRIQRDPGIGGMMDADKNKPMVEDKQEFYGAYGDLSKKAYYSYLAIRNYEKTAKEKKMDNDSLKAVYPEMPKYRDVYEKIMPKVVSNLSNTSGLKRYSRVTIKLDQYNDFYSDPKKNFSEVYTKKKKVKKDGVTKEVFYITLEHVKELVTDLETKADNFDTAIQNLANAGQPVLELLPYGQEPNQTNPVQWWIRMNNAIAGQPTTDVKNAAEEMLRAYSRVQAINACDEITGDLPEGWTALTDWKKEEKGYGGDKLCERVVSAQENYLTAGKKNDADIYLKSVSELESVSSSQAGNIKGENLYIEVNGEHKNLPDAVKWVNTEITNQRKVLQGYLDKLNVAIDGDGAKTPSMDDLKTAVIEYEKKLKEWKETTESTDTALSEEMKAEIAEVKGLNISVKTVEELKNRLVNIRSQFQTAIDGLDSLKLGEGKLLDIKTLNDYIANAGVDTSKIEITNQKLEEYAAQLFAQQFKPDPLPTAEHMDDDDYNLTINPDTKQVKTPDLYVQMDTQFQQAVNKEPDVDKSEKDQEAGKKAGEDAAKAAKDKNRYHGGGKNIPHDFSSGGPANAFDGLVGMVTNLFTGNFTGMRDDLYAATYALSMFSYGTYSNEGKYRLLEEQFPDKITELDTNQENLNKHYGTVTGDAETKGSWLSQKLFDGYNKTLTNKMINKTNNVGYEAEAEYVLFGQKENEENVKKAYGHIYTIRYPLNLVSGFQHFWSLTPSSSHPVTANAILGIARTIQGATSGIIPPAVTEAVLIPILTIFETCQDMERLEAGLPVELYKSRPGQWWRSLDPDIGSDEKAAIPDSFSGFVEAIKTGVAHKNKGEGIFYSDYLTLFMYLGFAGSSQDGMYQRMAEVIQANMRNAIGEGSTYSMKKSIVYFTLDAKLRVKPLMIALPIVNGKEYENEMDTNTDWCTYDISITRGY